ncbi:MAG: hypothetical protein HZA51_07040 [Planctomycetes bacterium]|nr:hypothetical protein [Planctomycetota bacterium]
MDTPRTNRKDAAARAITLSGLALAVSAVLGANSVLGAPADRHAPTATRLVAAVSTSMFDSGGLLVISGAAVLLIAWMQRQGLRSMVRIRQPMPIRVRAIRMDRTEQVRKQSISHHIGGLHGP